MITRIQRNASNGRRRQSAALLTCGMFLAALVGGAGCDQLYESVEEVAGSESDQRGELQPSENAAPDSPAPSAVDEPEPVAAPPAISPLEGEWIGREVWMCKQTMYEPELLVYEYEMEYEIAIDVDEDGIPCSLDLPMLLADGERAENIQARVLSPGESYDTESEARMSYGGQEMVMKSRCQITVREASFSAHGFTVVYDLDIITHYVGGMMDGDWRNMTGAVKCSAELKNGALEYTQAMDLDTEHSMSGFIQKHRFEVEGNALLTRN